VPFAAATCDDLEVFPYVHHTSVTDGHMTAHEDPSQGTVNALDGYRRLAWTPSFIPAPAPISRNHLLLLGDCLCKDSIRFTRERTVSHSVSLWTMILFIIEIAPERKS